MSQCDKRDGVVDGILSNPAACNFDPGKLQCGKSAAPDTCLTEPQVATARTFYSEVRSRSGARVYPAFWPGGESQGWPGWLTGGASMMPGAPVSPIGAQQGFYEGMVKYWLMADPSYDVLRFDFDEQATAVRQAGLMLNAGPDLTAFFALGHKLILWHGASDWAISAQAPSTTSMPSPIGRRRIEARRVDGVLPCAKRAALRRWQWRGHVFFHRAADRVG